MVSKLMDNFKQPPKGYGVIPFYWWSCGERITRKRIRWQLKQLKNHSISGVQINYAHDNKGGNSFGLTYTTTPGLFSEQWWKLVGWMLEECRKYDMSVSLSDYTLSSVGQGWHTDQILNDYPELCGKALFMEQYEYTSNEKISIDLPENIVSVVCIEKNMVIDLRNNIKHNKLDYCSPNASIIADVYFREEMNSIDPMNSRTGQLYCKYFFDPFETMTGGKGGEELNYFFSDELDFGIRGKLWNDEFQKEFLIRKGYDIIPKLSQLFIDTGEESVKTRLDYYDVIVQLEQDNFFKVIYDWHEVRNMVYGCDHGSRGYDVTEFGDYFRTQKFNQGPGCDQPDLQSDIIKNKVASSIAHVNGRKRVWLEGFYGSGWGTSSADLADAIARNYVMGQNLLSLHGLYYSTYGGWWEWAPPCNCHHMPYWKDMGGLLKAVERMSYLLSQGVHRCDVAVIYPVTDREAGQASEAVDTSFDTVKTLYSQGIDVDFIDYEAINASFVSEGRLCIAGEGYRILILPFMKVMRYCILEKLVAFKEQGGIVLIIGGAPAMSDAPAELTREMVKKLLYGTEVVPVDCDMAGLVRRYIKPDFYTDYKKSEVYINHRVVDKFDIFMVYGVPKGTECFFAATGRAYILDPFTGDRNSIVIKERTEDGTWLKLPREAKEFQLLLFDNSDDSCDMREEGRKSQIVSVLEEWNFEVLPCLDNQYGDYRLPASREFIGPEVRTFGYEESDNEERPANKELLKDCAYSYGPYFMQAGPFESEETFLDTAHRAVKGELIDFKEYEISMRYGVFGDPGEQGYHGLKGKVCNEFLTIGDKVLTSVGTNYVNGEAGFGRIFYTNVDNQEEGEVYLLTGKMKPDILFINGQAVDSAKGRVSLRKGANQIIFGYRNAGRTYLVFSKSKKLKQKYPLAMLWYKQKDLLPFDIKPVNKKYGFFSFEAPPGLKELEIHTELETTVFAGNNKYIPDKISENHQLVKIKEIREQGQRVILRVACGKGKYGGAVFEEPVKLICGKGMLKAVDWSEIDGLRSYSGGARYESSLEMKVYNPESLYTLELEEVVATATLYINSVCVSTKTNPPWKFDVTSFLKKGENKIAIEVYNTLANHYETIPTRYQGSKKSGIIGKCKLICHSKTKA